MLNQNYNTYTLIRSRLNISTQFLIFKYVVLLFLCHWNSKPNDRTSWATVESCSFNLFLGMVRISVYRSNHKYAFVVIYGIALASTLNYSLCFAHFQKQPRFRLVWKVQKVQRCQTVWNLKMLTQLDVIEHCDNEA